MVQFIHLGVSGYNAAFHQGLHCLQNYLFRVSQIQRVNPFHAKFFVLKMSVFFRSATYIEVHFRLDFVIESNTMNPDPLGSSLIWVHIVCNIGYQSTYADESRQQELKRIN